MGRKSHTWAPLSSLSMCDDTERSCDWKWSGVVWASKWHTFQSLGEQGTVLEAVGPPALLPSLTEVFVQTKKLMEEKLGSTLRP
jgi:hypothetical protein